MEDGYDCGDGNYDDALYSVITAIRERGDIYVEDT